MTQLFQQLRHRSRALAHGVLLVLLATWLSAVCPHCLAQVDEASAASPEMAGHCQHAAPPAKHMGEGHDCCPQAAAPVCDGGNCAQISTVANVESVAMLAVDAPLSAFTLDGLFSHAYPATPPPSAPSAYTAVPDSCPLYLRHCVFRN